MKYLLRSLKDLALILSVCVIVLSCMPHIGKGLTTALFFEGMLDLRNTELYIGLGILFISIQLVAMRWTGALMNMLLTFSSILLFALMATLALGPQISMTASLHQVAETMGMGHPLKANPALYWLIPLTWFLCLLGANGQVRTFCTALVCYALWLVFTPMLCNVVQNWANQEQPALPQIMEIMSGAAWMPAAVLGCFLLVFAIIVGLLDSIFPDKKPI